MKSSRPTPTFSLVLMFFVTALLVTGGSAAETGHKPKRTFDMRQYGYASEARDYSAVGFLSEDLLVVAINQAPNYYPHPLFEEKPDSTLVLLDVGNEKPPRVTRMPMFKFNDSMASASEGYFLVLTLSEVKLCSADFDCQRTFPTKGPIWLSSDRSKIVVGGNSMTPRVVLDSHLVPITGQSPETIQAAWQEQTRPDGSYIGSTSSLDGARLMTVETRQTRWSKIKNPLAGLGEPPFNSQRVTVYDKQTGHELFALRWDPRRGGTTRPALSPTGRRVALLRRGLLEVFEVP